jgi:Asp/Glu/hydantoin racemase
MPRVALIHALAHSVAPVNAEFEHVWPECVRMNLLDDSLSADLARAGSLDPAMHARFLQLADYAVGAGAEGLLFTCSAFGSCIDEVARRHPDVPVLKPNEAMIEDASRIGRRIALIATFEPTLQSMPAEFPSHSELLPMLAAGALDALDAGDPARHDALIVQAAQRAIAQGVEVIALAQFSMARAEPLVRQAVDIPVLTTVGSAVRAMHRALVS